jgi:hypothetical protein
MFRDEAVASIADSTRNDPKERDPRPGRTQPSKDSENGVRLQVDRIVLDQNNAGQFAGTFNLAFNYRLTGRRLLCGKAKSAVRIALYHESDPAVAEIANPVKQDKRRLPCDCHQLPTKTLLHAADVAIGDEPLVPAPAGLAEEIARSRSRIARTRAPYSRIGEIPEIRIRANPIQSDRITL